MALAEKDVRYIAELAHLHLTEEEVRQFLPQLDSILEYIQKLNELDTTQIEPMAQVTYPAGSNPAIREDRVAPLLSQEEALQNAPDSALGYFKVPRVIERE
ncbi:MAG: Asp-tRNA(Asn)/Glu-tRNA(Gln) amidotransferase subunit GatC [Terriglobia bacterium]